MLRLVKMGRAWSVKALEYIVAEFGNQYVKENYGEISRFLLNDIVAPSGYTVESWRWAEGGDRKKNCHWLAVLTKEKEDAEL